MLLLAEMETRKKQTLGELYVLEHSNEMPSTTTGDQEQQPWGTFKKNQRVRHVFEIPVMVWGSLNLSEMAGISSECSRLLLHCHCESVKQLFTAPFWKLQQPLKKEAPSYVICSKQ